VAYICYLDVLELNSWANPYATFSNRVDLCLHSYTLLPHQHFYSRPIIIYVMCSAQARALLYSNHLTSPDLIHVSPLTSLWSFRLLADGAINSSRLLRCSLPDIPSPPSQHLHNLGCDCCSDGDTDEDERLVDCVC